jgi:hypothetical protein
MQKLAGTEIVLGLAPQTYEIALHRDRERHVATVTLRQDRLVRLGAAQFTRTPLEATARRGGDATMAPVTVSVVPPLATAGPEVGSHAALNLLVGRGGRLEGGELGGLVNLRSDRIRGVQIAGLGNWNGGSASGVVLAGLGNRIGAGGTGLAISGLANWNGGGWRGIAVAGALNWTDGDVRGAQLSGGGNVSGGAVQGLQVSGGFNRAGDLDGLQIGSFNVGRAAVRGFQLGLVNVAGDVRGLQLGLVNVAGRARGLQLGLVNVAREHRGVPIGLVSAVGGGYRAVELWGSELVGAHAAFKLGAQRVYSLAAVGVTPDLFLCGLGMGVRLPVAGVFVDIDATAYETVTHGFAEGEIDLLSQLRVAVGLPLAQHWRLLLGASALGAFSFDGGDVELSPWVVERVSDGDFRLALAPGLFAGVAY